MCDPLTVGLILGGTALKAYGQHQAASRASDATRAAISRQEDYRTQAQRALANVLPEFEAPARGEKLARLEEEEIDRLGQSVATERQRLGEDLTTNVQGRVSDDLTRARAAETSRLTERAAKLAALLGKIRAPAVMAQGEAFERADLASRLGTIRDAASGQQGVDRLRISEAGQVNPLYGIAGDALAGVGTGMASAPGSATTQPPVTGTPLPPGNPIPPIPYVKPKVLK